ncbi:hypothetical protein BDD12DRAFT_810752 [Trichophaea hybrida]|nr:hypothetical protein BDD12DRAFT_810752 [Trichophaea hybrida]
MFSLLEEDAVEYAIESCPEGHETPGVMGEDQETLNRVEYETIVDWLSENSKVTLMTQKLVVEWEKKSTLTNCCLPRSIEEAQKTPLGPRYIQENQRPQELFGTQAGMPNYGRLYTPGGKILGGQGQTRYPTNNRYRPEIYTSPDGKVEGKSER